jgi:hypothetical protein
MLMQDPKLVWNGIIILSLSYVLIPLNLGIIRGKSLIMIHRNVLLHRQKLIQMGKNKIISISFLIQYRIIINNNYQILNKNGKEIKILKINAELHIENNNHHIKS